MNTSSKAGRSLGSSYVRQLTVVAGGRDFRPFPRRVPRAMMLRAGTQSEEG
jgi:hypothetical protein